MADTEIDGNTLKITAHQGEEVYVTMTAKGPMGPSTKQCWWDGNQWVCSQITITFVPSDAE